MKIYLTDQKKNFERHLYDLRTKSVMMYDKKLLTHKVSTIDIETDKVDYQKIFDYQIFPENIMTHFTEWKLKNREMKVGDTIVQQVFIPPSKTFSQKIIFGVRVNEIIDDTTRKGFSYETLDGHVEKGISTFIIDTYNNKTRFKIETYSEPGNILTKLMGTIFSKPYQQYSTEQALKNVKQQMEKKLKSSN